jgi:hypothetical protein
MNYKQLKIDLKKDIIKHKEYKESHDRLFTRYLYGKMIERRLRLLCKVRKKLN